MCGFLGFFLSAPRPICALQYYCTVQDVYILFPKMILNLCTLAFDACKSLSYTVLNLYRTYNMVRPRLCCAIFGESNPLLLPPYN